MSLQQPHVSSGSSSSPKKDDGVNNPEISCSSTSSSSLSHKWIYDVFLSFRVVDVNRGIVGHVQNEFQRKGIKPFIYDTSTRDEHVGPKLKRAIKGSKVAIVVLSKTYASSKWCLEELVDIIKCMEELGQIVFVVFYKVDPSEVNKPTGYFWEVFRNTCVGRYEAETERWRQALEKVASFDSYYSINWDNEAAMIEKIVSDISRELINFAHSFVGRKTHIESRISVWSWTHEVFLSFRGEDVRRDFCSHIQKDFQRKGIITFIDDEIERGEDIGHELIRAIRGSKIAIVVLSRNYASSKWCLDELVEIMKCREKLGQIVLPIFYKVDPSEIKKLTGHFGEIFKNTCMGRNEEDVKRWRRALEKVALIAGYHSTNWNNEATMIEKITTDVSEKLIVSVLSSDFYGFVGMKVHMEKLIRFLHLDQSDEVRMIGIGGPSGTGKSTIAKVLVGEYSHKFEFSVFIANIKRRYPRLCYDEDEYSLKLQLQTEMLSQIINQVENKIHHLGDAQDMLKGKKVLTVFDDVDHLAQLDVLAEETRWFGPGSLIIITTQDKRVLNGYGINHIHEVGFPSDDEALQILCMNAFDQNRPKDGFESLAREVTLFTGNLPLGLRIMGSHFRGMSKHEWKMELPRLWTILDEIESVLKCSYDALCDEDKELFIDIACFFKNEHVAKVEKILANKFSNVRRGLQVMVDKYLISIESWGLIRMHDLLSRLGRKLFVNNQFTTSRCSPAGSRENQRYLRSPAES